MRELLSQILAEFSALMQAPDEREYVIVRLEKLFDQLVEPMDLPGPDRVIDPLLRAAIRPLVGRIFDELNKRMEVPLHA